MSFEWPNFISKLKGQMIFCKSLTPLFTNSTVRAMPQRIAVLISSLLFSPIAFAHFQGFGGSAYSVILTIVFFIHLLTVGPLLLVYIRRHKYSLLPGFLIFLVGSAILVPMEAMALFPLAAALLILKNGDFILLTGLILASLASIVYMVNSWRK